MKKINFKENKKKIIIAVLVAVLCVCTASGVIIGAEQKRNAQEKTPASSALQTASSIEAQSENEMQSENEIQSESETQEAQSESTSNAQTKAEKTTKNASTEKAQTTQSEKSTEPEIKKVCVTVTINCKHAAEYGAEVPDYFVSGAKYTAEQGATVFDALESVCADNGLAIEYKRKTYIEGIGGLKALDCGASSGWTYRVNGELIMKAASKCELNDGDRIEWIYVTDASQ